MTLLQSQRLRLLEQFAGLAGRLATRLGRDERRAAHLELGRQGEDAAYFYLRRQGCTVVARAWRSAKVRGDLDLVGWENGTLCFFEVKTRTSKSFATAESAVDEEKIRTLRRLARHYIRTLPSPPERTRFDVVSIYWDLGKQGEPELERFAGAFGWY